MKSVSRKKSVSLLLYLSYNYKTIIVLSQAIFIFIYQIFSLLFGQFEFLDNPENRSNHTHNSSIIR